MARLWSTGFDINSLTAEGYTTTGTPSITATNAHSGNSMLINSLTSATAKGMNYQFMFSTSTSLFIRFYLYINTLPTADNTIMQSSGSNTIPQTTMPAIKLSSTGTLKYFLGATQIGSASAALSTGQWYCIEMNNNATAASGSRIMQVRVDGGTPFVSITNGTQSSGAFLTLGGNTFSETQTTGSWQFDDVAINDNTGSFQNSWPGLGKVLTLWPTGTGDLNQLATAVGGTAGAANNYTRVNENPPDDVTTYNQQVPNSSSFTDLYALSGVSAIGASDTVNVFHVGVRAKNNTATANSQVAPVIEKTSSGTHATGSVFTPNTSVTWRQNNTTNPFNYLISLYQDPDGSTWNPATWVPQIGVTVTGTSTNAIQVTNVFAVIDYTPAPPTPITFTQTGVARITEQITKNQTAVARVTATVTKTQAGVGRVAKSFSATLTGVARIAKAFTATQTATARIVNSLTKTQPATARITEAITKNQTATARITETITKTQSATARVSKSFTATQPAVSRISLTRTATQSGVANIVAASANTKTQTATARISKGFTKTQTATARISNSGTKTQLATARITEQVTKLQTATARVSKGLSTTQPAVARIAKSFTLTQTGVARIAVAGSKTQSATARVSAIVTKTQAGTARIINTATKTQTATARITEQITKTQSATARVQKSFTKTQTAVSRVAIASTKTQSATGRISKGLTLTQPATARIAITATKTQTAVARVSKSFTKTQSGVANIVAAVGNSKTQTGTARIQAGVTKTQPATGRVQKSLTRTQPATSRVTESITKLQPGTARISAAQLKTQAATARISKSFTFTQGGIARLQKAFTKTVAGISRVQIAGSKTQPATGRVAKQLTKTQAGTANIVSGATQRTFTQTGTARIADRLYSRGSYASLPSGNSPLTTLFSPTDYTQVLTIDSVYVDTSNNIGYAVVEWMVYSADTSKSIAMFWTGKSTRSCVDKPVVLQLYNLNSGLWETIGQNTITAANSEFTLGAVQLANLSNYYDTHGYCYGRVYQ